MPRREFAVFISRLWRPPEKRKNFVRSWHILGHQLGPSLAYFAGRTAGKALYRTASALQIRKLRHEPRKNHRPILPQLAKIGKTTILEAEPAASALSGRRTLSEHIYRQIYRTKFGGSFWGPIYGAERLVGGRGCMALRKTDGRARELRKDLCRCARSQTRTGIEMA